jgi:2-dehydro-3-deoxyphosphogluconate aldolase/(4S)-4-hydroxy-2-oxoglutarate aldolase
MTRTEGLIQEMKRCQLTVAIRTATPEDAYHAARACMDGGVRFIEITFSVPQADEVIQRLSTDERVVVGAGTVLTVEEAKRAVKAGASYIVSPNFDEDVVKFTKKEGLLSVPGACTPTEIYRAHKAGGDIIKLFPFVEIGGLGFLKAIRGPLPFVNYMLCGGANLENVSNYLAAEAAGILIGTAIIRRDLVAAKDWKAVAGLAATFAAKAEDFRHSKA